MKSTFLKKMLVILLSFTITHSFAEIDRAASYYIKKTAADATLNKNESVFEISFAVGNSTLTKGSVQFSYNTVTKKEALNELIVLSKSDSNNIDAAKD